MYEAKSALRSVTLYTVLSAKSDSDDMFCLKSYQGHVIDKSLVYIRIGLIRK